MPDTNADTSTAVDKPPVADGVRDLAMVAPLVGIPALLHAFTGLIVGGIGFAPILLASGVLAKQLLPADMSFGDLIQSISKDADPKASPTASEAVKDVQGS